MPATACLSAAALPIVTDPVRLSDLPALLGPYAVSAPVYVYLRDLRQHLGDPPSGSKMKKT